MKYRPYVVPLQAFIAVFLCVGIAWMMVVMAGFNPNPPTAMDIKLRSSADVSLVSMNSTAAALAVQMLSDFAPTEIVLPSTEVVITAVPTRTLSFVLIPVSGPSATPSPTPFSLLSLIFPPTKTREPDPSRTPTDAATSTLQPTSTSTATPIPTTAVPTLTSEPTDTLTPVPPTATEQPTDTNTSPPPPPDTTTPEPPTSTPAPPTTEPPPSDTPTS